MDAELKAIIREVEESTFSFFAKACMIQHRNGRFWLYEQPRNSQLRQTETAIELRNSTHANSEFLCMCMHDLKCPITNRPHMKPTVLEGTVPLSGRTLRWCDKNHTHEHLNGTLPNGKLRTATAQAYTKTYCRRLLRDIRTFLFSFLDKTNRAYPGDEDELAIEDPYEPPEPLRVRPRLQPTAKRAPKPETTTPGNAARVGSSSDPAPAQQDVEPALESMRNLEQEWEKELEESIDAGNKAADNMNPVRRKTVKLPEPASDLVAGDLPPDPEPLTSKKDIPLPEDQCEVMKTMSKNYSQRISAGVTATIQAGQRLKLLQEMFGTPHNITVLAAHVAKRPRSTIQPEPLISREVAPKLMEVYVYSGDKWFRTKWQDYTTTFFSAKKIPYWTFCIYGKEQNNELVLKNPYEELAQLAQDATQPVRTLPAFMDALIKGTIEERTSLILTLHRRLYHINATNLKRLLHKAGVPLSILSSVDDILSGCEACRAFAAPGARPIVKLNVASRFNQCVYFDLVFMDEAVLFIGVDEAIRWTSIACVEYKTFDSLESAFRRHWVAHYGPCSVFRADKESAFANDKFAVYAARINMKVELITAGMQHTWLGILDRRVRMIRKLFPLLLRDLSAEHMNVEPEDLAAELMHACNTQFTLNGSTPYRCLYGCDPAPFFQEDDEFIVPEEAHNIFYEHLLVRTKAIAAFQQALVDERIERNLASRNRTDNQMSYKPGQSVDFWKRSERKQLEGWRGPATILQLLGEGFASVRWQSQIIDVPINQIRPHIFRTPIPALPAPPAPPQLTDAPPAAIQESIHFMNSSWEEYYHLEAVDNPIDTAFEALVSVASSLPVTNQVIHGVINRKGVIGPTEAAARDNCVLFNLGKQTAGLRGIPNYLGTIIVAGRRQVSTPPGVKCFHIFWWTGDTTSTLNQASVEGGKTIDFVLGLHVPQADVFHLRAVVLMEGPPVLGPPMHELLKLPEPEEPLTNPARVRIPIVQPAIQPEIKLEFNADELQSTVRVDVDDLGTTIAQSDSPEIESNPIALDDEEERWFYADGDQWYMLSENPETTAAFPVDRATRPIAAEEMKIHAKVIREARCKELQSWIDNRTGVPRKRQQWETENHCKAIPSRWVDCWKLKGGQLIAKCRLCLKGFAEPVTADEVKASPTANRTSHRIVKQTACQRGWLLTSLDVSVAFLKGFTFDELALMGNKRKPVAFVPCADVWNILAELAPSEFGHVTANPSEWVYELQKAAYGLRDAPLLWHLKAIEVLKSLGYRSMLHDSCTFVLRDPKTQELQAVLTLHVDDFLMASTESVALQLQEQLSKTFGTLTLDRADKGFRHFGVDVLQDRKLNTVTASQEKYVADLKPIEIPNRCLKTAECTSEKATEFRALVSAIAWVGVTSSLALTSASLLQGCLPTPTWGDVVKLNTNLAQLKEVYTPLIYQFIPPPHRLLSVGDSSFANSGKYSQNGFITVLCNASEQHLAGAICLLDFKSNKSKRVATSTLHAEALASINGLESTTHLQSYFLELQKPGLSAMDLLAPETHSELIPIVAVTDCNDLHDSLIAPVQPTSSNKHLALYIAAIREFKATGRVQAFSWIDTRDMVANSLTKLKEDGTAELEINAVLSTATWNLAHAYKWNSTWCAE